MLPCNPSLSLQLAQFAQQLSLEEVPEHVRYLARLHLADALGVGLGAAAVPAQRRLLRQLSQEGGGAGPCTVLGLAGGFAAPVAALLNGTSIHSLEYDDTHMASIVHGSAVIVAAALAAAEAQQASLDEVLRLVIAGWEALVRIGEASPGGFQRQGFQVTSVGGVVVAAMLGAVARGASLEEIQSAMGIAGSQAGGIFEFLSNGSNVKALHPGWAAHSGLWAAACARGGMTGPASVLEGRFGLFQTYAADPQAGPRMALGLQDLGQRWRLEQAAFKLYPCCHYIHPYLECALELLPQIGSPEDILAVHCQVAPGAATVICEPWSGKQQPASTNAGKYSLPYCLALLLLERPLDVPAMTGLLVDPEAVALASRIHWSSRGDSRFPTCFDAALRIELRDGRVLHAAVEQVLGSAERPAGEAAIKEKFLRNAGATLGLERAQSAWELLLSGQNLAPLQQILQQASYVG